jgi:hypothetical protein
MNIRSVTLFAAVMLISLSVGSNALAQGKGKGGGQGQGQGSGQGKGQGQGQGQGQSDSSGKGNSTTTTSSDSPGKSNDHGKGEEQKALHAHQKAAKLTDKDLNRYKGLSKKLGTTPEVMRARYEAALVNNPDLTYGNFVSAHMAADNLGDRYPNVTSDAILIGMSRGRSLGQTLQDLKVTPQHSVLVQDTIKTKMRTILGN